MVPLPTRRDFLTISFGGLYFGGLTQLASAGRNQRDFTISLNERSLHRSLTEKKIDHLDVAALAKNDFGIEAVDYVTSFFSPQLGKEGYINQMNKRAAEHGVRQVLLIVDDAGALAHPQAKQRTAAVEKHRAWIDVARTLGCHAVCVSTAGDGPAAERLQRSVECLQQLAEFAGKGKIHVLVSNNDGAAKTEWLVELLKGVDSPHVGAFLAFTGFEVPDPYEAMQMAMPFAKGVCATAQQFDERGNETSVDFSRMMKTVLDAGYRGYVSLEYRGDKPDESAGIRATKSLLDRIKAAEANV